MTELPELRILDLARGEFGSYSGFYFGLFEKDEIQELHGPYPTRYAAVLAAVEFTATVYLATEEQEN